MKKTIMGIFFTVSTLFIYSCRETADVDTLQDEEQETEQSTEEVELENYN